MNLNYLLFSDSCSDIVLHFSVCIYQNKEYKIGSKIITSDICQACRCRDGIPPYISCVTRECIEFFDKSGPQCHSVFKEDRCCPVGIECSKYIFL